MKNTTQAIENAAKGWSKLLKEEAQRRAPKHIAPHIVSTVGGSRASKYTIKLAVNRVSTETTDGTDDAVAQEYGSGIHGSKHSTYIIKAKRKKALAFITQNPTVIKYSKSQKNRGRKVEPLAQSPTTKKAVTKNTMGGNIVLVRAPRVVHHPGIKPYNGVGYLRPAIKTAKEVMLWGESKKISKAILMDIKEGIFSGRK